MPAAKQENDKVSNFIDFDHYQIQTDESNLSALCSLCFKFVCTWF